MIVCYLSVYPASLAAQGHRRPRRGKSFTPMSSFRSQPKVFAPPTRRSRILCGSAYLFFSCEGVPA
jgi:hypothetical protein